MVTGFEKETSELTEDELKNVVPLLVWGLSGKIGEKKAITSGAIIEKLKGRGVSLSPARFRKCINHIRTNNLVNLLLASNKGYYVAESIGDAYRFRDSLDERANAIIQVRDAIEYQIKQQELKN